MANYGLDMTITRQPLGFCYGEDVTGPMPEIRTLDQIRPSLRNPDCEGPEQVYAIAMDVARLADRPELEKRMLLLVWSPTRQARLAMSRSAARTCSPY